MLRALAGAALALFLTASGAPAAPNFPALSGRVVDNANILSPQVEGELTDKLAGLEASTGRQLVVATLPSLQGYEIEDYGYQLGRAWGIGEAKKNTGVLFIVAPGERKVRIEVGYGLEPILTDALSSVILQTAVIPKFKAGDMSGGVVAGTDALVQQLTLPEDQAKAQVAAAKAPSAGGKHKGGGFPIIFILLFIFIVSGVFGGRRRRRGGMGGVLPGLIIGSALSNLGRGGGNDWGGGGGFGGGGGGFGGGGGSFGGGGSSGGW